MKPTAFHIPSKSVMAGAKPYKPGRERPAQCHAKGIDMKGQKQKRLQLES